MDRSETSFCWMLGARKKAIRVTMGMRSNTWAQERSSDGGQI